MQNFRRAGIFAFSMMLVMVVGSVLISVLLSKTGSDSLLLQYGLFYGLQFLLPILVYFYLTKESPREALRVQLPKAYTFVSVRAARPACAHAALRLQLVAFS